LFIKKTLQIETGWIADRTIVEFPAIIGPTIWDCLRTWYIMEDQEHWPCEATSSEQWNV